MTEVPKFRPGDKVEFIHIAFDGGLYEVEHVSANAFTPHPDVFLRRVTNDPNGVKPIFGWVNAKYLAKYARLVKADEEQAPARVYDTSMPPRFDTGELVRWDHAPREELRGLLWEVQTANIRLANGEVGVVIESPLRRYLVVEGELSRAEGAPIDPEATGRGAYHGPAWVREERDKSFKPGDKVKMIDAVDASPHRPVWTVTGYAAETGRVSLTRIRDDDECSEVTALVPPHQLKLAEGENAEPGFSKVDGTISRVATEEKKEAETRVSTDACFAYAFGGDDVPDPTNFTVFEAYDPESFVEVDVPAEGNPEEDYVHKPAHYVQWVCEPMWFIEVNNLSFAAGNVIKYQMRAVGEHPKLYDGLTEKESRKRDLEKAKRYCEVQIAKLDGNLTLARELMDEMRVDLLLADDDGTEF